MTRSTRTFAALAFLVSVTSNALAQSPFAPRLSQEAVSSAGVVGDSDSSSPRLTPDARWVLFRSSSTQLVPNDTNSGQDLFLRDRTTGLISRQNVRADGSQVPAGVGVYRMTPDARFVVYSSPINIVAPDGNGLDDVFVRDRTTGSVTRVSVTPTGAIGDDPSHPTGISDDGRWVLFESTATNLVAGDVNGAMDVFLRDMVAGVTQCVSSSASGIPVSGINSALSGDGLTVVFGSGSSAVVANDTNSASDIFWINVASGERRCLSRNASGAFGNNSSLNPTMSADGNVVLFESFASNLVPGDAGISLDIFRCDIATQTLSRLLIGPQQLAPFASHYQLDSTGTRLAIVGSDAFVSGDTNGHLDALVIDLETQQASVRSFASTGAALNGPVGPMVSLSDDGRVTAFDTVATNVWPGGINFRSEVYSLDVAPLPIVYCTAKVNSLGCTPTIAANGLLRVSNGLPFVVSASQVLNQRPGLLIYSLAGRAAIPFQAGTLCVQPPLRRTNTLDSGGSSAPTQDCSGVFTFDFMQRVNSGVDPQLVPGTGVWATFWSRDPGFVFPDNTGLTDAVEFGVYL